MNSSKLGLLLLFFTVFTLSEIINVTDLSGKQSIIFNQTTGLLTILPSSNAPIGPSIGAGIRLPFLQTLASSYGFYANYPGFYSVQAPRFWILKNPTKNQSKGNDSSLSSGSTGTANASTPAKIQAKQKAVTETGKLLDFPKSENNNANENQKQAPKVVQQKKQNKNQNVSDKLEGASVATQTTATKTADAKIVEQKKPVQQKKAAEQKKPDEQKKTNEKTGPSVAQSSSVPAVTQAAPVQTETPAPMAPAQTLPVQAAVAETSPQTKQQNKVSSADQKKTESNNVITQEGKIDLPKPAITTIDVSGGQKQAPKPVVAASSEAEAPNAVQQPNHDTAAHAEQPAKANP